MLTIALTIAFAAIAASALLTIWRLVKGPDAPDRVLALDTLYVDAVALVILLGVAFDTQSLFEGAILVALIGFVSTVAVARYVFRGGVVD
jgi:multicomponent K+:H+ antiporter subunit F